MPKRTWSQANISQELPSQTSPTSASPQSNSFSNGITQSPSRPQTAQTAADNDSPHVPHISRKVKACAACRKQKIKCLMEDGPPCKRCVERKLSCVLNKSLQTLIDERSQWKDTMSHDLEHMHSALQEVLKRLGLPTMTHLETPRAPRDDGSPPDQYVEPTTEEAGPSCDNSPKLSPRDDELPHAPIESLYQITRLRSLRSEDVGAAPLSAHSNGQNQIHDFISSGQLPLEDAERLFHLYRDRLDHFMYGIGGRYKELDTLRRNSPILLASICTVAAYHDAQSSHLYGICSREFQHLMQASMFNRRIDRDHLRAMIIASYWLSDVSWILSGYAIRRAAEVNLNNSFHRAIGNGSEDAADCMRLWYVLYICDQHLSILYGRPSLLRDDFSIMGWEQFLKTSFVTDSDKRLVSQVALLMIMNNIRELFGPDTGEPVPQAFTAQIAHFGRLLDQWVGHWSTGIQSSHPYIGEFPRKGVLLHYHFAKLHLHSHVFRGPPHHALPTYFYEQASAAVSSASSIVEFLCSDTELAEALCGMPHYLHTMTAFACVFLIKVATKQDGRFVDRGTVYDLTNRLVGKMRGTAIGRHHLLHLMADGLERMAIAMVRTPPASANDAITPSAIPSNDTTGAANAFANGQMTTFATTNNDPLLASGLGLQGFADHDFGGGGSPFFGFDQGGNLDLGYAGFGFL